MVEAVLTFAVLSAVFEGIVLLKAPRGVRDWILRSKFGTGVAHASIFAANLSIHWGTITGSMTAIVAALASFAVVPVVRWYCRTTSHA